MIAWLPVLASHSSGRGLWLAPPLPRKPLGYCSSHDLTARSVPMTIQVCRVRWTTFAGEPSCGSSQTSGVRPYSFQV